MSSELYGGQDPIALEAPHMPVDPRDQVIEAARMLVQDQRRWKYPKLDHLRDALDALDGSRRLQEDR